MSDKEFDPQTEGEEGNEARIYELGYLLAPTITEENLGASYGNLKELVSSLGGEIISDEMPKNIPLAYMMQKVVNNVRNKYNTAYFGWIKFYMSTERVLELKKKLDLHPELVRFLILKTVKENTIAARRFIGRDTIRRRPPTHKTPESVESEPINKEEIDKEIEAMVAN